MNTKDALRISAVLTSIMLFLMMPACSDSSNSKSNDAAEDSPHADTSYLDSLAAEQGIKLDEDESFDEELPVEAEIEVNNIDDEDADSEPQEEQREWERERESKSLLGRSRDKGLDIRDQLQGSTTPGEGLAYTHSDEEYASSSGLRWEMPEDWRMAIPPKGRFAEMYIKNPYGNASVSFSKETASTRDLIRSMQGQIIDPSGGRSRAQTAQKTIVGRDVQIIDLEGTYLDPGAKGGTREQIFYAMHAAIFEMGDSRILIKMWGPQDTVNQSKRLFDKMIDQTTTQ